MRLESVLDEWSEWPLQERPVLLKEFSQGLNHRTYLLKADQQHWVLKIFSADGQQEVTAQTQAAQMGIAPNIVHVAASYRYVLMQWLPADCLADFPPSTKLTPETLTALATALHRLHQSKQRASTETTETPFNILSFCEEYLTTAGEKAQRYHPSIRPLLESFLQDTTPHCFCHNDLVRENCFIAKDKAWFIDWEYADWHNPWFDLAAIVSYSELSEQQARAFIKAYHPEFFARFDESILPIAQVALLWGDILWHLAKFGEGYWHKLERKWQQLTSLASALGVEISDV